MTKLKFAQILSLTVFFTGASVMVLEIVAMRFFSPYFGNTLYTSSSIIGVILGALSIGYYFGGRISDKNPSKSLFFSLITISGVLVLILHLIHKVLLPLFAYKLSTASGSLIFSLSFFLLPNIFLGMLSPFAVKLKSLNNEKGNSGKNSGDIFFISTLGSIVGSFLCGFYLIPNFGVNNIINSTAFFLVLIGLVGFISTKKTIGLFVISTFIVSLSTLYFGENFVYKQPNVVFEEDGVYQRIKVLDHDYEGRHARFLFQDQNNSSATFLDNPDEIVFKYTKYYEFSKIRGESVKNALVIGAGAYTVPSALSRAFPNANIEAVDIEPNLDLLSERYFKYIPSKNIIPIVADGRRFLNLSNKKYDFIFLDAYSSLHSIPPHLVTKNFFSIVKEHLSEEGILVVNTIGTLTPSNSNFTASFYKTFSEVFKENMAFLTVTQNYKELQNIMFVASNSPIDIASIPEKFQSNRVDLASFSKTASPFTDDYSPVEYDTSISFN